MSDKAARSYTHLSNRAKARATAERKNIYKSVLENPFRIQWLPSIPSNAQKLFLAKLITTLESEVRNGSRKSFKACARKALPQSEIADSVEGTNPSLGSVVCSKTSACAVGSTSSQAPVGYMTVGINEVTKRLELQLKYSVRHSVTLTTTSPANPIFPEMSPIAVVFVCRADVNPPILLDHIPHLVAGCNSTRLGSNPLGARQPLKLIVLPMGSESALAQVLGLRRASVIAIHNDAPYLPIFCDMLQSVPVISAPWLVPPIQHNSPKCLIPTHIKQLRTTAPKDMKSAKEQREKARVTAKKNGTKRRPILTKATPDA
ncbi:uncharacterized protein EDB93DRAFT_1077566 [Suillus bovinus]|uniref:uncharacterized protein n=1 Tax=Suillus bovinus TaxID=48563 RepID=UPI001B8674C4|nr:uncharacterized protein EDB93DRAFT_1077566 [Suillus bovinus]KAG2157938.1 hypothetical protein EDB93DRAFT_1077566 [Suillus bovinus]